MAKKKQNKAPLTPEEVAEKAHPGWKAVPPTPVADAAPQAPPDAVGVDVERILAKHGQTKRRRVAARPAGKGDAALVPLASEATTDRLGPRRTSVVEGDTEIGHSG